MISISAALLLLASQPAAASEERELSENPAINESAASETQKVILKSSDDLSVAKGDPSQTVCKKFPPPLGTRIGRVQVCKSRAEWDKEKREIREGMDKIQTRNPGENAG